MFDSVSVEKSANSLGSGEKNQRKGERETSFGLSHMGRFVGGGVQVKNLSFARTKKQKVGVHREVGGT